MANYVGQARSNCFRVRDEEAFLAWVDTLPGVVAQRENRDRELFVLLVEDADGGGWPNWRYHEDIEDEEELDLHAELAEHLTEGEVAILQEIGAEKLRYLVGYAIAVNHKGETLSVSIDEIYQMVQEAGWGDEVSTATY